MPAQSRSQQRFMGMVHAAQKGELEHPSAAVKKAAASIKPGDAEDFASTSHKGLPEGMNVQQMLETIAEYASLGSALRRNSSIREVGAKISRMVEIAEQAVMTEAEDWHDTVTLKRHFKELKNYGSEFMKAAEEADILEQRMGALYEDIGRVLERYFELPQVQEELPAYTGEYADGLPKTTAPVDPGKGQLTVKENEEMPIPQEEPSEAGRKTPDELTLRAIQAVHKQLLQTNPELAEKFKNLPAKKMVQVVWRLVK